MVGPNSSEPRTDASSAAVLDPLTFDELHESLAAQPDALLGIYRKFLQGAAISINSLAEQDAATRVSTVHTLKGSAGMLGALRLAAAAAQLQEQFGSVPAPPVDDAIQRLNAELDAFRQQINLRFASLGLQAP